MKRIEKSELSKIYKWGSFPPLGSEDIYVPSQATADMPWLTGPDIWLGFGRPPPGRMENNPFENKIMRNKRWEGEVLPKLR